MRRRRSSAFQPVMCRSGVTASVRHRKRSTQSPVPRSKASAGLAPRLLLMAPLISSAKGHSASTNSSRLGGAVRQQGVHG